MADPVRKLPSFDELYAEILALREGLTGEILQPGVVRVMSRPAGAHRRAARWCLEALGGKDQGVRGTGWWIEVEAEVRIPGDRLAVPDLSGFRVERVPVLPDENTFASEAAAHRPTGEAGEVSKRQRAQYPLTVLPDWCCEVLSPTTRDDRRLKLPLYAECAVPHAWLVDPTLHIVEGYETTPGLKPALVASAADDEKAALPPFDHVVIDLAAFWLPPNPKSVRPRRRTRFTGMPATHPGRPGGRRHGHLQRPGLQPRPCRPTVWRVAPVTDIGSGPRRGRVDISLPLRLAAGVSSVAEAP